ncbi:MAG: exodeoxyribonuclease VII large subunit [Gammaproteobacteria bacterium]
MPQNQPSDRTEPDIYTVSRLNREARRLLESGLGRVWIAGEVSNLARPASGHIYFSLKDENSQVRCAMFRNANRGLTFKPEDGMQVLVQAKVGLYEPRGEYQLVAERMEEAGEGLLRRNFEELKAKLDAEGLFSAAIKQQLPALPAMIGVVTSPTGAAVRDILHILRRRYPAAGVIIYPTRVQGEGASDEIVAAIETAVERKESDVLIIARGGGSLEDLWSFNEENVARAIAACSIPTVSGVGHEVDITIADLVADIRAPTPSGAAELVTPDRSVLLRAINDLHRRAGLMLKQQLAVSAENLRRTRTSLNRLHPGAVLDQLRQTGDELTGRMTDALLERIAELRAEYRLLTLRLKHTAPADRIERLQEQLTANRLSMAAELRELINMLSTRAAVAAGSLNAVSPLATLERGYSIVRDTKGQVARDASRLKSGDSIEIQLARGRAAATVTKVSKD